MDSKASVAHVVDWKGGWSGYAIIVGGVIVKRLSSSSASEASKALREFRKV